MKSWFAASEVDLSDIRYRASFVNDAAQKIQGKELGMLAVEVFVGAKAITAMKIADVGQLHAQTPWSIITGKRGLCLHQLRSGQQANKFAATPGRSRSRPAKRSNALVCRASFESRSRFGAAIAVS